MIYLYGVTREVKSDQLPDAAVFGGAVELMSVDDLTLVVEHVEAVVLQEMLGEGARDDDTILHNAVMAHQGFINSVAKAADIV
ncbi:MAG: GvpL/GvpF family gas vesicle protein, partial [Pseudomonadota bacterium]